jgi:hypothetical protein
MYLSDKHPTLMNRGNTATLLDVKYRPNTGDSLDLRHIEDSRWRTNKWPMFVPAQSSQDEADV